MISNERPVLADLDLPTSSSLASVRRDTLTNSAGVKYREIRLLLTPKYPLVWMQLLAGHTVLVLTALAAMVLDHKLPELRYLTIICSCLLLGYTIAYIQLFFHEAAHYNLSKRRERNDTLANIFIGAMIGQDIKVYRPIHFDHHRYLGTPLDTERTYFDPLNLRFLIESLTGFRSLKVLVCRKKMTQFDLSNRKSVTSSSSRQLFIGMALNVTIPIAAAYFKFWSLAVSWLLAILIAFPLFAGLRQLLEHRDEGANKDIDYRTVPTEPLTECLEPDRSRARSEVQDSTDTSFIIGIRRSHARA